MPMFVGTGLGNEFIKQARLKIELKLKLRSDNISMRMFSSCRLLILPVFISSFLFTASSLNAKPYLKIQQVRSIDYPYIHVEVSLANVTPIKNLDMNSFQLYENSWKVNSFYIKKVEPIKNPKNIILLLDSSYSLSEKQFKIQSSAALSFAKALSANDRLAVLSFNNKVRNHCGFISNEIKMVECIQNIKRKGTKTVLFDALFESLKLSQKLGPERHFVILFTDGRDEGSLMTFHDIVSKLYRLNTPIFVIATGSKEKLRPLVRISKVSGGDIYHVNHIENLSKIYLLLNELLDNSYILKYISQASNTSLDGKQVKLEVRVNTNGFIEEDSYTFFLRGFSFTEWLHAFKENRNYLLFGLGGLGILLFLLLLYLIFRTPKLKLVPHKPSKPSDTQKAKESPLLEEYLRHQDQQQHDEVSHLPPILEKHPPPLPSSEMAEPKRNLAQAIKNQHISKKYRAYLVEKEGPNTGRKYHFSWDNVLIGYSDENSIAIDDPGVSNQHAKIKKQDETYILYDLLSENGTYLNGKKVLRPLSLSDFDEIQLGKTKLIFRKVSIE